jgi:hypothetical protein
LENYFGARSPYVLAGVCLPHKVEEDRCVDQHGAMLINDFSRPRRRPIPLGFAFAVPDW